MQKALTLRNPRTFAIEFAIACGGSGFLILLSQWAIPLPFTPIPLTMQTLAVFLLGGTLGSRRGMYSVLAYLGEGCCGLPVFAGWSANPLWFLEPKAGFLLSFIIAAFAIGKLLEKKGSSLGFIFLALLLGQCLISGIGMAWLSLFVGIPKAFFIGVFPFLVGAALKVSAGTLCLKGYSLL